MAVPYVCRRKFTKIATTGRLQNRFNNKLVVSNLTNIVKVAMTQNKVAKQPKRIKCQDEYKNIRSLLLIN